MKLGQLIEYNMKKKCFFSKIEADEADNEADRLVPHLFLFFKVS